MPKYKVTIFETLSHTLEITADTSEVALDLAYDIVDNDSAPYTTESLGTYDSNLEEIN